MAGMRHTLRRIEHEERRLVTRTRVWYLLQAPLAPGPYPPTFEAHTVVMDTLPWKEWEIERSLPTLEACETARKQLQSDDAAKSIWCALLRVPGREQSVRCQALPLPDQLKEAPPESMPSLANALWMQVKELSCVADDDPQYVGNSGGCTIERLRDQKSPSSRPGICWQFRPALSGSPMSAQALLHSRGSAFFVPSN
jgi:hypothetical protein